MKKEENIQDIRVIAVKNKEEVLKAAELFGKVGIKIFGSEESKQRFIKNGGDVKDNFLMRDDDGSCRIQSHFITDGMSISELSKRVSEFLKKGGKVRKTYKAEKGTRQICNILKSEKDYFEGLSRTINPQIVGDVIQAYKKIEKEKKLKNKNTGKK